ncbi:hypothetical protein Mal15_68640 [Stieleria maiorica]|uniref:Uncharacterized protein n=1 Tax=Stieleria maiorica TaxID=2795974 RepID=A0A5B9MN52_9BACT|nr:hypothetical protein [Stieleria maiorica]QEG02743.1 hypothetical protein Mal15_68640 [Stieleria maiorica]
MYAQLIGAWGRFTYDLMAERYDIHVEHVSDITDSNKLSYERGYNSLALDHIAQQDGADAWDAIQDEIRAFRDDYYRKHLGTQT